MTGQPFTIWRGNGSEHSSDARRSGTRLIFGRETLHVAPGDAAPTEGATRIAGSTTGRLHLVVQVGNRFQAEHPDVPVLYSKGRYLLVDLDPASAAARARDACYSVRPVGASATIYEERGRAAGRERRADVQQVLDNVSGSRLRDRVEAFAALRTRESTSSEFRDAAADAKATFEGLGYTVEMPEITVGAGHSQNIVAERAGTGASPRPVVIVTAHLDSVNHETPGGRAPGADDNGSGAAGVLEMAECMADGNHSADLRFILFGGEEQGLFGSTQYVAGLASSNRVSAVINMDMIATINTQARSVLIEGGPVSQALIDRLAETAATYTDLSVQTSLHFFNSDHVPFIEAGIPAVLLIEGNDSANDVVHTSRDTLDRVDDALMTDIVRMGMAAVLELAI
jgi:Zn-dependent M28 family amino/carboxypeptidase